MVSTGEIDVVEKFLKLAVKVLPEAQARTLVDAVLHMDELDDAAELIGLLAAPGE
jgi:hypothetical protein